MKVEGWIQTNRFGSKVSFEVEVPDDELEGMDDEGREAHIEEYVRDAMWNYAEWGWRELK